MNVGKTLFAQVMEFVPWKTFGRIVQRHKGDVGIRTLGCAELFRVMAFAQLTWRESLRDIESCLAANQGKLFHMGLKVSPARSTLSDALNQRDWRIYHALAQRLIVRARSLYAQEPSVLELDASVYALDSTTIDLCLSLFEWAPFRSTKAAIKLHTLLDLRGAIPAFIHISDGKLHDVNVLDILPVEAGAFYVMDRGYVDFERLWGFDKVRYRGLAKNATRAFVTLAMANIYLARRPLLAQVRGPSSVSVEPGLLRNALHIRSEPSEIDKIKLSPTPVQLFAKKSGLISVALVLLCQ
jgi:Domain of unknown function (DUF4372)